MVITLTGSNFYLLKRQLDEITWRFIDKYGELSVERFDGEESDSKSIFEGLKSLPLLARKKLVVIRNGAANKELTEQVEQIISSIDESAEVIFYEPKIDKRSTYFKVLKSQTELREYSEMDSHSLAKWLVDEAKKQNGNLSLADANYLVERLGANQSMLFNELQKLLIYEPSITKSNIDLLSEPNPRSKVFDLLDAAFSGNKKRAMQLYDEQRAQKVEPQAVMALLAWQLEIIALAKYGKNKDANQIGKEAGVSPYALMKVQRLAAKLSEPKLKAMVDTVLEIDVRSKTTPLDLDEALKTYILFSF